MGFDNEYPNRKDRRKPYRKSKAVDGTCRNNGGCDYCKGNRMYRHRKNQQAADDSLTDWELGIDDE